jgi:galactose oxidase
MPNLGNAWHIPDGAELRTLAGMRSPIGPIMPGTAVTICSGNQFQGFGGNPGDQLQVGSAIFFKRSTDAAWQTQPMLFRAEIGNNKYYAAPIPTATFGTGDVVHYYLRIAYGDRDTTFVFQNQGASATTASEAVARAAPFAFTIDDPAVKGQWAPVFALPNVGIHAHVLPNGNVLMWGRRDNPNASLDIHECTPFVWNPKNGTFTSTPQPTRADGTKVNLFCSGHAFLPDGRLLVVGGHFADGDGLSQASLYDWNTNKWTATSPMATPNGDEVRRWYPTARTLPDGTVLVLSGSYVDPTQPPGKQTIVADLLQVWDNGAWNVIDQANGPPLNFIGLPLYPRMHIASDGRVFMSGSNDRTLLLKTVEPGEWTDVAFRSLGNRDYCPAVMYDANRIVYIGGGNEAATHVPTAAVERIDLGATPRQWERTGSMHQPRRQHNATLLPDGTVFVTGGTRGGGGANNGFNDLGAGEPVHMAEMWNPNSGTFTELSAEEVPRCYHSTAVLLPDATVLSAGGGEYRPDNVNPNPPEDSQRNAQIFSPPYLFKGGRPTIDASPASVAYGESFQITTPQPSQIGKVTLIRLASVTHSFDENQHVNFLAFSVVAGSLRVTAPASSNECPPGHYMLFLVSTAGVPSVASMVQVRPTVNAVLAPLRAAAAGRAVAPKAGRKMYLQVYDNAAQIEHAAKGTAVLVGITGTCPYGIGACWGGAYEALRRLEAVALVGPIPNTGDSTADVFLTDDRLPPLAAWQRQFQRIANGSYEFRGVEVTLDGAIELRDGDLFLARSAHRPAVRLSSLAPEDKLQWDHVVRARKPLEHGEAQAYAALLAEARRGNNRIASVTGPLEVSGEGYALRVRQFSATS